MSSDEKKWQARDDLYTLQRAEEIKADKSRVTAAKGEASVMIKEQQQRLEALKKISASKTSSTTTSSKAKQQPSKSNTQQPSKSNTQKQTQSKKGR